MSLIMSAEVIPSHGDGARSTRSGSLAAGLDIIETLTQNVDGMGVTAIARSLGLDKGNVHRLLQVLEERGYVEQDVATRAYRASGQIVALGGRLLRSLDLVSVSRPIMHDLSVRTGEAVHLAQRTRSGAVYVARDSQSAGVTVETEIGAQPAIHVTATGKAIYCFSTKEELEEILPQPLTAYTGRSITSLEALLVNLREAQERGYAVDVGELSRDVNCVAAPIFDIYGMPSGSIGFSAPATRMGRSRIEELGRLVHTASVRITEETGGHVPSTIGAHPTPVMEVSQNDATQYYPQ